MLGTPLENLVLLPSHGRSWLTRHIDAETSTPLRLQSLVDVVQKLPFEFLEISRFLFDVTFHVRLVGQLLQSTQLGLRIDRVEVWLHGAVIDHERALFPVLNSAQI